MSIRRSHYELAFEAYLARRGTPFVAVEDVVHFAKHKTGTKTFDYIVYPPDGRACLIDVKGRKSRLPTSDADARQKTWVTREDIEGLLNWQDAFGSDHVSAFVFAYWLVDQDDFGPADAGKDGGRIFGFAGRQYSFWFVPVAEYVNHQKQLSKRWDTVSVPRLTFRQISRAVESVWPAAPC